MIIIVSDTEMRANKIQLYQLQHFWTVQKKFRVHWYVYSTEHEVDWRALP
jgi:hypothetical protein